MLTTCFVYCGPFFLTFCFNNTVAWIYGVRTLPEISSACSSCSAHSFLRPDDLLLLLLPLLLRGSNEIMA